MAHSLEYSDPLPKMSMSFDLLRSTCWYVAGSEYSGVTVLVAFISTVLYSVTM